MMVPPPTFLNAILLFIHLRGLGVPIWRLWTVMNWLPSFGGGAIALETPTVEPRDGPGEEACCAAEEVGVPAPEVPPAWRVAAGWERRAREQIQLVVLC
jgi:hypothetical protein